MNEVTHGDLTPEQNAAVAAAGVNDPESKYLISETGVVLGFRYLEMKDGGKPVKWSEPFGLDGKPLPEPPKAERKPREKQAAALPEVPPEALVRSPDNPRVPAMSVWTGAQLVLREKLMPSPLNPRKNFDLEYLNQLAETLGRQGIINDLIVRRLEYRTRAPKISNGWGVEWKRGDEWVSVWHHFKKPAAFLVTEEDAKAAVAWLPQFEIVAGECRWRASEMAAIAELPVKIREMSDADVLELMLVENMRRKDLTIVEESEAFSRALAQKNGDGSPFYPTTEAFARKIGESRQYIEQRLALMKLPASGRAALECDDISFKTARVICSVPESLVAKVIEVVLHPGKHNIWIGAERRALNAEEAQRYIRSHVVRELRDTPFQQNDAKLLPVELDAAGERVRGGACTDCPWNSANQVGEEPGNGTKRGAGRPRGDSKWCMNPECFAKKVEIHSAAALVKAKEAGCTILTAAESAKLLHDDGAVRGTAQYVRLDEKPGYGERNEKIDEKKLPTWGKIVTGRASAKVVTGRNEEGEAERSDVTGDVDVPVSVAVTARGHVVKLVAKRDAMAAAQKLGTAHFLSLSSGGGRSLQRDSHAEMQRKEREEIKLRGEVSFAAMAELVGAIAGSNQAMLEVYGWLVDVAIWHGGHDAHHFVAKRRGLPATSPEKEIRALGAKGTPGDRLALALEILVARPVKFSGVNEPLFKSLCGLYGIDAAKIDKEIRAAAAAKKREKKKKETAAKKRETAKNGDKNGLGALIAGRKKRIREERTGPGRRRVITIAAGEKLPIKARVETELPPERQEEFAKLDAMHAAGKEITVATVQGELKLRGTKHAEWLVNQWKKKQAPPAKADGIKVPKPAKKAKRPTISAAGRAKIVEAMNARWAKRLKYPRAGKGGAE